MGQFDSGPRLRFDHHDWDSHGQEERDQDQESEAGAKHSNRQASRRRVLEQGRAACGPRQPGVEPRKNHPSRAKHGYIQLILTQSVPRSGSRATWSKFGLGLPAISDSAGPGDVRHAQ